MCYQGRVVTGRLSYGVPTRCGGPLSREQTPYHHDMTAPNLHWIADYHWGIADDALREVEEIRVA